MVRIVILGERTQTLGMLADALQKGGYRVRVLTDSKWRISVLSYLSPHFVIVDAENPNFSAAKVCTKIRSDHSLVRVRILVLNPSHDREENQQAACAADVYVNRPFDPKAVVSRVRGLLKTEPAERTYRKISIDTLVIAPASLSGDPPRRGSRLGLHRIPAFAPSGLLSEYRPQSRRIAAGGVEISGGHSPDS